MKTFLFVLGGAGVGLMITFLLGALSGGVDGILYVIAAAMFGMSGAVIRVSHYFSYTS